MKEFWNERYAATEYAYGIKPNEFLKETLDKYKPTGTILFPAEGEGRNAVYAAKKGLNVSAFDISEEGKKKALQLAQENNVNIDYQLGSLEEISLVPASFDSVALIYVHFPLSLRKGFHAKISDLVKPNGILILEGFSRNNLSFRKKNPNIGGPDKIEMLFTKDDIEIEFPNFDTLLLEEKEVELNEGKFHKGTGSVVRFIGRKKKVK